MILMVLKLFRPIESNPSWMTSVNPKPVEVIVEKPSAGFVKYVENTTKSPEMRKILLSSESAREKYKTEAKKRQHVLTPEEMKRGQEALARGGFGVKSGMTLAQEHAEELAEKQYKKEHPEEEKYKRFITKRPLKTQEEYREIEEFVIRQREINESMGLGGYFNVSKPISQSQDIKKFINEGLSLGKSKPTTRLIKPIVKVMSLQELAKQSRDIERMKQADIAARQRQAELAKKKEMRTLFGGIFGTQEPVKTPKPQPVRTIKPIVRQDTGMRSLFGGMFETPTPKKVVKPTPKKQKKPVQKKIRIVKKYYRKYPKHCTKW